MSCFGLTSALDFPHFSRHASLTTMEVTVSENEWKEQAQSMIGKTVLAPSSHNTQPWLFRLSKSAIDICADRTRALPSNDPEEPDLLARVSLSEQSNASAEDAQLAGFIESRRTYRSGS